MLTNREKDTSCLREHLNMGEPGLAIKSPSCPPITKSRSSTAMQALHQISTVRRKTINFLLKTMNDTTFQVFHQKANQALETQYSYTQKLNENNIVNY